SLFELLQQVLKSPATPDKKTEAGMDDLILKLLTDRSVKAKAPEFLQPKSRWPDRETLIAHFRQSRDRNIAYIQTTADDPPGPARSREREEPHHPVRRAPVRRCRPRARAPGPRHTGRVVVSAAWFRRRYSPGDRRDCPHRTAPAPKASTASTPAPL